MTTPPKKAYAKVMTKAARGSVWVFAQRVVVQLLVAAKLLVLARLLSPNDFGIMGIALLTISLFETFSVTGFDAALVSKPGEIESYLDTAWTIAILRGFCLALIAYWSASVVAHFFQTPEVENILRAIALVFLVRGLVNSATVYFQRDMDFKNNFSLGLAESVSDALVSISLAFILCSVWALVIGFLAGTLAKTIASYALHPRRPSLRLDVGKVRDLSGFGRWFWGGNVLTYLGTQIDSVVVARLLGPASLGLYQVANRIALYFTREVMEAISQVTFPMYARLVGERDRLRESFLFATRLSFGITFPVALVAILYAEPLVNLALGAKWLDAAPVLRILAVSSLLRGLSGLGSWFFFAIGSPKLSFLITSVRLGVLCVFLVPLSLWLGLVGAALAVLLANSCMFVLVSALAIREIGVGWLNFLRNLGPSLILGPVLLGVAYALSASRPELAIYPWSPLGIVAASGVVYAAGILYLERNLLRRLKKAFASQW